MQQPVLARANLTAEQLLDIRMSMRSEVMELVAGSQHTLAQSRALLTEADAILALDKSIFVGRKRPGR